MWRSVLRTAVTMAMGLAAPTTAVAQTETVTYFHTDAIGSVRMITDATGAVVERHDYLPFGEEWLPPSPNPERRLYAGKERDQESAFDYVGARYYASQTGRFTTTDPMLDQQKALLEPQRWNRYAYALNNPLKFVDPDGREPAITQRQLDFELPKWGYWAFGVSTVAGAAVLGGPTAWRAAVGCFLSPSCQSSSIDILEGAAGGAPRVTPTGATGSSGEIGQLIGWGTGQAAKEVAQTVRVTRELTAGRVAELAKQGVTREWVEKQLALYGKSLESGNRKLENTQLLPRIELMEKLLELWPEQ